MTLVDLFILGLATWRISHFISNDEIFPFLEWLRVKCGVAYNERNERYAKNWVAKQILCQWCNSLWIGMAIGGLDVLFPNTFRYICLPWALSTISILIQISRPMQYYYK
jgi:hypothetical protein